jgi:hypothetical protein
VAIHTATKNKTMRTKTLLIAIGALAAGLFSSQAQVTSANVVGYANIPALGNQAFNAVANPFSAGVSNGLNEVFPTLPNGSQVFLFVGGTYQIYGYDASIGDHDNNWFDGGFDADIENFPIVAPGTGTFLVLPASSPNATNSFIGSVAVNIGATNTATYTQGIYSFAGSVVPYAGQIDGTNVNLLMPNGSELYQWDPVHSTFVISGYDASIGDHSNNWFDGGFDADLANPPVVSVGDSFFIVPGGFSGSGTYQWKQTLHP